MNDGILNLLPINIRKLVEGTVNVKSSSSQKAIAEGIKWNKNMALSYNSNVVDERTSADVARYLEKCEEILVDKIINLNLRKRNEGTILLEIGVGTGRNLIRYGSRIIGNSQESDSHFVQSEKPEEHQNCIILGSEKKYRKYPVFKDCNSVGDAYYKNLKLAIGIDFEESMIRQCLSLMKGRGLKSLIGNRIFLFLAAGQYFNLDFEKSDEYQRCFRIITCQFQTLGNQHRKQQIELLENMKRLAWPKGKVIVSVFNRDKFFDFGLNIFYKDVLPTVGSPSNNSSALKMRNQGILVTDRGVYSQWFTKTELIELFRVAGMEAKIVSDENESIYNSEHIDYKARKQYKDVARDVLIIAEADVSDRATKKKAI